jgi:hypothetical protein
VDSAVEHREAVLSLLRQRADETTTIGETHATMRDLAARITASNRQAA